MSTCGRCRSEFSFFDGFMTRKGMICARCHEIDGLSEKLADILSMDSPATLWEAFEKKPKDLPHALRLAEIDRTRRNLRIVLFAMAYDRKETIEEKFDAKSEERADSLEFLFTRDRKRSRIEALINEGFIERGAKLLRENVTEAREEWFPVVEKLHDGGARNDAVEFVLRNRGVNSRTIIEIVARGASSENRAGVASWLAGSKFVSPSDIVFFLAHIRRRESSSELPAGYYHELLEIAVSRLSATGSQIPLLRDLGENDRLCGQIASISQLDAVTLEAFEFLAPSGEVTELFSALERLVAPGPYAQRISALAQKLAPSPEKALELMLRADAFPQARDFVAQTWDAKSSQAQAVRRACASRMAIGEIEANGKFEKAIEAARNGDMKNAHALLRSIIQASGFNAPIVCRSAATVELILRAAELHTAIHVVERMDRLATRRKVRQPLPDQGVFAKEFPRILDSFLKSCEHYIAAETAPHFVLLWPAAFTYDDFAAEREADAKKDERFETAGNAKLAPGLTERELARPTLIANVSNFLLRASGATAKSPAGMRAIERAEFFGIVTDILEAPPEALAKGEKSVRHVGDRSLVIEFAARALAFMPPARAIGGSKWGEHLFRYKQILQHYGQSTIGFVRPIEHRPCWVDSDRISEPEGVSLVPTDHLPWLDGGAPFALRDHYRHDAPLG